MKLKQVASYIRDHGVRGSAVLTADRLFGRKAPEVSYELWQSRNRPSSHDYLKMEKAVLPVKCKVAVTAMMNSADRTAFFQSLEMQVYREFRALKNCNCPDYILIVNGPCTLKRFFRGGNLYITLNSSMIRNQLYFQKDVLIEKMNAYLSQDELFTSDNRTVGYIENLILK